MGVISVEFPSIGLGTIVADLTKKGADLTTLGQQRKKWGFDKKLLLLNGWNYYCKQGYTPVSPTEQKKTILIFYKLILRILLLKMEWWLKILILMKNFDNSCQNLCLCQ